jgi:hypothetical protein
MSFGLRTFYNVLVGAWGGLLAWAILDLVLRLRLTNVWLDAVLNGAFVGMFIGALVSGFAGLMAARVFLLARGAGIGLLTGIVGGILGLLAGQIAFLIGGLVSEDLLVRGMFRAIGWAIFGAGIGVAEGVITLSFKRLIYGGMGGVIGGLAGGIIFALIERGLNLQLLNRALGFAILGACIGLFIGLIPSLLKEAWLKVTSSGRNEGNQFIVDKATTTLGSSDRCDIGLYGDAGIAPKHAEIRQEGGKFVLHTIGGQRVMINDRDTTRAELDDGTRVRVGNTKLVFRRRKS